MAETDEGTEEYRKIFFRLQRDEHGYPPDDWETLWAREVEPGLFGIDNVPFYVRGVSWKDVVDVEEQENELHFKSVVRPSGHSVLRIIVYDLPAVEELRESLRGLGCSSEASHIEGFLAVDVPPSVSLDEVRRFLDPGEAAERWEYEEGSLRHA